MNLNFTHKYNIFTFSMSVVEIPTFRRLTFLSLFTDNHTNHYSYILFMACAHIFAEIFQNSDGFLVRGKKKKE